jgi:guanylate kinase
MQVKGTLYVVAAPSGGGKTSLVRALLNEVDNIEVSISYTTRERRPNEVEGRDYFFISDDTFQKMVKNDEFVEHATVFGHSYGTSKAQLLERLNQGIDVLLDIDWQGARQLSSLYANLETIFILPPSLDILHERLLNRAEDKLDTIEKRMKDARDEIKHYPEFDYLIINECFETALNELKSIVYAHRLKQDLQSVRHKKLLSNLLS